MAEPRPGILSARLLSSLVLAPAALAAIYFGFPYFEAMILVCAAVMAWEWSRLVSGGVYGLPGGALSLGCAAAVAIGAVLGPDQGLLAVVAAIAVIAILAWVLVRPAAGWLALGTPYIAVPCIAVVWLRGDPAAGLAAVIWLMVVVWSTDVGAYAAGRTIGGPKLAPRISPNKTWAGLVGGVVAAGLAGAVVTAFWDPLALAPMTVISMALAIVAQMGDLFESGVKRHFKVKDSSNLIPGHGGLLDRVDGIVSAAVVAALVKLADFEGLPL